MGRGGSRTTILVFTFSIWAAISSLGQVQTGDDDWRKRPDPLVSAKSDSVSAGVRAIRNKFFDRVYGPPPKGVFSDGPDVGPIFEEIPTFKGLTVAIVRFADYRTIRSARRRSVYTEIRMNVEQVLEDPSRKVRPGGDLTVILAGGSLNLRSGAILQRDLEQGSECGIQPGGRYLAFLSYAPNGGQYFDCTKTWGLSGGVATPTYPFDLRNAGSGTSHSAGMPEAQFIAAVREVLASARAK